MPSEYQDDPTLAAALEAFRLGYQPVPIREREKRPATSGWQKLRSGSIEDIRALLESHAGNLGLITGDASSGLVDIDLDTTYAVAAAPFLLPDTAMQMGRESSPRSHLFFRLTGEVPPYRKLTLPDGETLMEMRTSEHQTLIPPSIHPSGETYEWSGSPFGGDEGPAIIEDPKALLSRFLMTGMIATLAHAWPSPGSRHDAYLALVGGLLRYDPVDGEESVHPAWKRHVANMIRVLAILTHDRDGAEQRVQESVDSTLRRLNTRQQVHGWPTLGRIIGESYLTRVFGYVQEIEKLSGHRDRSEFARARNSGEHVVDEHVYVGGPKGHTHVPRAQEQDSEDWDPATQALLADGWGNIDWTPLTSDPNAGPKATMLRRLEDGAGLLYEGLLGTLYGAQGSCKSWLALKAVVECVKAEKRVMIRDFEDGPRLTLNRLLQLGLESDAIIEYVGYASPRRPIGRLMVNRWGELVTSEEGTYQAKRFEADLEEWDPHLLVFDGLTRLFGTHQANPNDTQTADRVMEWLRELTLVPGGRAVLTIDHVSKKTPAGGDPAGNHQKTARVTGCALHVIPITLPQKGKIGELEIHIGAGKDRPGDVLELRANSDQTLVAIATLDSTVPNKVELTLRAPREDELTVDNAAGKANAKDKPGLQWTPELVRAWLDVIGVPPGTGQDATWERVKFATQQDDAPRPTQEQVREAVRVRNSRTD